ncbi:MAG: ABC transporter substrate-binding protein [Bilophila wadsworthia]
MRFKTLFAVCALFGSLFQSSPSLSETLRTAWLGEHEAFLTWYAKEKGWDKEAGLDIIMLRFDSGKSLIENVRAYDWAIAGCGAVPAMQATMSDQVEVIAIAIDDSSANMSLTRPDSPILAEKGFNPDFPNVFGTPESVKGKLILCPKKTSARYLLDKWLAALGLEEKDVKIEELEPTPALGAFKGTAISSPSVAVHPRAETLGFKVAAHSQDCGATQPVSLTRIARSRKIRTCVRFENLCGLWMRSRRRARNIDPAMLLRGVDGQKVFEADAAAELRNIPSFRWRSSLPCSGKMGKAR